MLWKITLLFFAILNGCKVRDGGSKTQTSAELVTQSSLALNAGDVSILFPKDFVTQRPYPEISVNATTANGKPLLSPSLYKSLEDAIKQSKFSVPHPLRDVRFGGGGDAPLIARLPKGHIDVENWYVHGFRIDDCGPPPGSVESIEKIRSDGHCLIQLRLILHPVLNLLADFVDDEESMGGDSDYLPRFTDPFINSKFRTPDIALHLVYIIGEGAFPKDLLEALQHLKLASPLATDNLTLGVHPGLMKDMAGAKDFGEATKQFILNWASKSTLSGIAVLSIADFEGQISQDQMWLFLQGRISNDTFTQLPISNLGGQLFQPVSKFVRVSGFPPTPKNPFNVTSNMVLDSPHGQVSPTEKFDRFLTRYAQLLNLRDVHVNTADCLSCHKLITGGIPASFPTGMTEEDFKALATKFSRPVFPPEINAFPIGGGKPETGEDQAVSYNLRNFGYHFAFPTISIRAASESAWVAHSINQKYGLTTERKGCDNTEVQLKVLACLERSWDLKCVDECRNLNGSQK